MPPSDLLQQALRLHAAGNLSAAQSLYQQILSADRNHSHALHHLGLIHLQRNDLPAALPLLRRSIQRAPNIPVFHLNLARALESSNQPDLAAASYQRFADLQPQNLSATFQAALALAKLSRFDPAFTLFQRALSLNPNSAEAHANLGVLLAKSNRHQDAVASFERAISLEPQTPAFHLNLGLSLKALSRFGASLAAYDRALALSPNLPEAHEFRGLSLAALSRHPEAITSYQESLRLNPNSPTAWNNLGVSLQKLGTDPAAALDAFRRALSLAPSYAEAHNNLGTATIDVGQPPADSLPHYTRAIELAPNRADFRLNRALALLAAGDFAHGWPEHESRLQCPQWSFLTPILKTRPNWDGSSIPNQTLLIHAEQGFGDAIQFARFFPLAAARCRHLYIHCHPPLARLFRVSFPSATILLPTDPLPPIDFQLPQLSLPAVLQTTLDALPNTVPYLTVSPDLTTTWRDRLSSFQNSLQIALVWSGSTTDPHRALHLSQLAPLASLPHATFYSLQLNQSLSEAPFPLIDLSPHLSDFADTAAALMNLDLLITIDTAAAHLAGALARPAHVLLRFAPDWRWSLSQSTTPWYPTLHLHRQPAPNDWPSAISHLLSHLER